MYFLRIHLPRILLSLIFIGAGFNGWFVILGFDPIFPTSPDPGDFCTHCRKHSAFSHL